MWLQQVCLDWEVFTLALCKRLLHKSTAKIVDAESDFVLAKTLSLTLRKRRRAMSVSSWTHQDTGNASQPALSFSISQMETKRNTVKGKDA